MLFFLLIGGIIGEPINDGDTMTGEISGIASTTSRYSFEYITMSYGDLTVSVTSFSDYSDPYLYISVDSEPTEKLYSYKNTAWGLASITIPNAELTLESTYNILIVCNTYCRYSISLSLSRPILLQDNIPFSSSLQASKSVEL